MIEASALPNGDLILKVDFEGREWLRDHPKAHDDVAMLIEGMEHYWANGGFHPFSAGDGNPFVGLTSAPCIAESLRMNHDEFEIEGRLWWFPDYMVISPIDELRDKGYVTFTFAHCYDEVPA